MFTLGKLLIAVVAGGLLALSFEPYNYSYLAPVSLILLVAIIYRPTESVFSAAIMGWAYGSSLYLIGTPWIANSVQTYGGLDEMTSQYVLVAFSLFLGLFYALPCMIFRFLIKMEVRAFIRGKIPDELKSNRGVRAVLLFTALWLFSEWLRSIVFTGFPWFNIGTAMTNTFFAGLYPLIGETGVGASVLISSVAFVAFLLSGHNAVGRLLIMVMGIAPFGAAFYFGQVQTTESVGSAVVRTVHTALAPEVKWAAGGYEKSITQLHAATGNEGEIVLWPEAAIPLSSTDPRFEPLKSRLRTLYEGRGTALISGFITESNGKSYNSIGVFSKGNGVFHKEKLVPFGEYIPLSEIFIPLMKRLGVQVYPGLASGKNQSSLYLTILNGISVAPGICWEVAFRDTFLQRASGAQLLVSSTNMSWFQSSVAEKQLLQIAQVRAMESQRWLLHSTNFAGSAVISPLGIIHHTRSSKGAAGATTTRITLQDGTTRAMQIKTWWVPALIFILYLLTSIYRLFIRRFGGNG